MLYYEKHGSDNAEIVLLIHGIATSSWVFWQQIPTLEKYQVRVVDLPGHGENLNIPWTSLDKITSRISQEVLENQPAHITGISLGGHVALDFG